MSLKDQLLEESKTIDTSIELDSVFESVDLNEDLKTQFSAVFESAVKARAITLAESHINAIAERSDELVASKVEEGLQEINESVNTYFDHLVEEWKEDNKIALENGMKVDLFESMMASLKAVFVEHNVEIPTESVNVVSEMELELAESATELNKLVREKRELTNEINSLKMSESVKTATANLTESQKEKVATLVEGYKFDDKFQAKLDAIVEFVSKSPAEKAKSPEDTAKQEEEQTKKATKQTDANSAGNKTGKIDENLDALNGEKQLDESKKNEVPDYMQQYISAV